MALGGTDLLPRLGLTASKNYPWYVSCSELRLLGLACSSLHPVGLLHLAKAF